MPPPTTPSPPVLVNAIPGTITVAYRAASFGISPCKHSSCENSPFKSCTCRMSPYDGEKASLFQYKPALSTSTVSLYFTISLLERVVSLMLAFVMLAPGLVTSETITRATLEDMNIVIVKPTVVSHSYINKHYYCYILWYLAHFTLLRSKIRRDIQHHVIVHIWHKRLAMQEP